MGGTLLRRALKGSFLALGRKDADPLAVPTPPPVPDLSILGPVDCALATAAHVGQMICHRFDVLVKSPTENKGTALPFVRLFRTKR